MRVQTIETALHDIDVLIEKGVSPSDITWIVFWNSSVYQDFDLDNFQETADSLGINMEYVENKKQFINYINFKNKQGDDMDIILGTLGQPRGFKMFTPCLGIGDSYPYIENLFT